MIGIYKITNPNGKIYIGQSSNIEKRFYSYKKLNCKGQKKLYNSLIKYGVINHKYEILQLCEKEQLNELEVYYIELFQTFNNKNGLNLKSGGCANCNYSDESKKKMSDIRKQAHKSPNSKYKYANRNNSGSLMGIKRSEQTIKKMSISATGRVFSDEARLKMSLSAKNRGISKNVIQKMVESRKKIILNTSTGIYYLGVEDAASSVGRKKKWLQPKLSGERFNKTDFLYV